MKMKSTNYIRERYIRCLPTPFCPGCGGGIILNAFARAVDNTEIDQKKILVVSGIGCSSWIPSPFFKSDILHTPHGRAIAYATGAKLAKPSLNVIVFTGDGDCAGIGGNHFIHAARRNIDMTVICVNNFVYGMTGGQVAPTTPTGKYTSTTPDGNKERPFDLCKLAVSAGATFVARWTTYHVRQIIATIEDGIKHNGFSFIEILSQCPTHYGRKNQIKTPSDMLKWFKENTTINDTDTTKIKIGHIIS